MKFLLFILGFLSILNLVNTACVDKVKSCSRASNMCNDTKLGSSIRKNCPLSCGMCQGRSSGCLENSRCSMWARNGYCTSSIYSKAQRMSMCPKSCGNTKCIKPITNTNKPPTKRKPRKKPAKTERKYAPFANSMNEAVKPCNDFYQFACECEKVNYFIGIYADDSEDFLLITRNLKRTQKLISKNDTKFIGKYIQKHPPKVATDVFATFNDLETNVAKQQKALLFGNEKTTSTAVKKMRDFRDKCMNTSEVEKVKTDQLRLDLVTIGKCPIIDSSWTAASFNLTNTLIEMVKLTGNNFLFDIEASRIPEDNTVSAIFSPADLIIKKLDTYSDPKMTDKLTALKTFLSTIMNITATDGKSTKTFNEIETAITEVMNMEKKISQILMTNGYQNPDPTKQPKSEKKKYNDLGTIVTSVNWPDYIQKNTRVSTEVKNYFGTNPDIRVFTEKMLKELDTYYKDSSTIPILANYLCLQFLIKQIPFLDSRFSKAANEFATKLDGSPHKSTRDQDCFDCIIEKFPLVSDHLYVKKHLSPQTVKAMSNMIEDLRSGLNDVFKGEKWMSATTKSNAEKKIKKTKKIIGAVDDVKDVNKLDGRYTGVTFSTGDTLPKMAAKIKEQIGQQALLKLVNKKFDTESESMRATDVNAMHVYEENLIYMSAAVLQPPFFDIKQPASVQYGAVGFIVGHEFTHGFDSGGAEYDESGLKKDWWDANTKKEFENRSQCFINLYGKQKEPTVNKNVDGNLTIPENIADNGGIRGAFRAYKKHLRGRNERHVSGYRKYTNDQTFFISYGTSFCSSMSKEQIESRLVSDTHSPTRFRVNVVLSNYPEFAKAFKCPKGTPMNPKDQCAVW